MKSTIHMVRTGNPPPRAYEILARHFKLHLKDSDSPRLLIPFKSRGQSKLRTFATTERLVKISEQELADLLLQALNKRSKHVIFRQRNRGGYLFAYAKNHDSLY